ncbi:uncharacterized protein G2W53_001444 [Senna tora]|uniref:Uncharacterized protein n=1 Tax=Senna tora TaxID=362788 RepID=A0A834XFX8_9FABA|nr:uncharacterized protein G2W53_001444 [Senna tora]
MRPPTSIENRRAEATDIRRAPSCSGQGCAIQRETASRDLN